MSSIRVCHICEKECPAEYGFVYMKGRDILFICKNCDRKRAKAQDIVLPEFDLKILSFMDFVLIFGERGTGRKKLCSLFFECLPSSSKTIVFYDSPSVAYKSVPRYGCNIISTVMPPDGFERKPTYLVFTPITVEGDWDAYFSTVCRCCETYGDINQWHKLDSVWSKWKAIPGSALVINTSTGNAGYVIIAAAPVSS